ncbi:MAG: DNA-binding Lrp family transcriptional regulator [Alteromonadaceae bacterium]|jgi:DNA-binding Lrp family transcriptional regulator
MNKETSTQLTLSQQRQLRSILEKGLPIVAKPYLLIAEKISAQEQQVIEQIDLWQKKSLIKRFGLVVKHRQLGYTANAMVVWDIENSQVDTIAKKLSKRTEISLCYRRPRRLPDWSYNLFCMIHGQDRGEVLTQIENLTTELNLHVFNKDILFSNKAYKQQGARYGLTATKASKRVNL